MRRIKPIDKEAASNEQRAVLNSFEQAMGGVPNMISTIAHSPAVANAFLVFSQTLSTGSLKPHLRARLALFVGQAHDSGYCVSIHSALGAKVGLSDDEIIAARRGTSADTRVATALSFTRKLVRERGKVSDADVAELRSSGFSDGEIGEIGAHVALNIFTNYFNHVAGTEIDFPVAAALPT